MFFTCSSVYKYAKECLIFFQFAAFKIRQNSVHMNSDLSFDALYGIYHHSHSTLGQRLKTLLRVDIHTRQPAAEAGMRVIPAHHHLWSNNQ